MSITDFMKRTNAPTWLRPSLPSFVPVALTSGLMVAALGLATPVPAEACPNEEESCDCSEAPKQAAPNSEAARPAAAGQRAVLDPETGELVAPQQGETDGVESGEASGARAPIASSEGEARQLAIPGAGVIAPFPVERVSRAVAKVDENGQATGGCEQGIE